jgi:YVTN family beta-propeller protein
MRSTMAGMTIASLVASSAVAQTARSPSHDDAVAPYAIQQQYTLGGPGGWDYLTIDAAARHLYISRADRVLVMSTQDGSIVATIANTQGVHGVALAPELGEGFTSNGRADSVTVFDLKSLLATKVIAISGHNPDAILYDTASKHVYTFNGESQDISVIDPKAGTVIATLAAGGKPEFAQADGTGRIFFNIEDRSQIGSIDSLAVKRLANWALPNCVGPTGLAFDVRHERLFSVCGNGVLVVTDSRSGRHVAEVPIGKGPDAAAFDEQRSLIFSSNGEDGTLTVIHEADPNHYSVIENIATQKSARTMALDQVTHRMYLVAAEFGTRPPPSADQPHPRAPVVEGSFKVLVVGN